MGFASYLEQIIEKLSTALDSIPDDFSEVRLEGQQLLSELIGNLELATHPDVDLAHELRMTKGRLQAVHDEMAAVRARVTELETENDKLRGLRRELKAELRALRRKLDEAQATIDDLRSGAIPRDHLGRQRPGRGRGSKPPKGGI